MPYRVTLTKLSKNKNAFRTQSIDGFCNALPKVGNGFIVLAEPLESGDVRKVWTSNVKEIISKGKRDIRFLTQHSEYHLGIVRKVKRNPYKLPLPIMIQID
jgi:hypothetical protein